MIRLLHSLHNHCIPHAGNDYRPHLLQKVALLGMAALILLSFAIANLQALIWMSSDWMISTILPAVIVSETNVERAAGAADQLVRNDKLDRAAQLKAEHMAARHYFAHFSPEGVSPWYWFAEVEYPFVHAGENLAIHFTDSSAVVRAWMASPTHRANIMNSDFSEIGIGIAEGVYEGYPTLYVVQLFGTPAAPLAELESVAPLAIASELATSPATTSATTSVIAVALQNATGSDQEVLAVRPEASTTPEVAGEVMATLPVDLQEQRITMNDVVVTSFMYEISTSTSAMPATIDAKTPISTDALPLAAVATKPQLILNTLYIAIGAIIVLVLLLSILIEIRRQHPAQIAYGLGLLALMWGLHHIHSTLTSGAAVL